MNYLSFFELSQEPFSNAPVSRYYFGSQQHGRALVRLMHAVESMKGLAVLIGDIGAGKTTTARRLLESLPEDQYEAALLVMVQSGVSPQWLITKIAFQLGVTQPSEDKTRLLGQLYRRLYAIHESGRKAVVLVDEAQMLNSRELMAEVRGLLNMEIPDEKLLTILFFGLPDLEDHLKLDPPLYQRVAVRCHLDPLSLEATEAYIKHRLKLAGASRMLFTQEAVQAIHRASSGIPRLINTICDNALFEGFLSRANPITARLVETVVAELGYDGVTERGGMRAGATTWGSFGGEGARPRTSRAVEASASAGAAPLRDTGPAGELGGTPGGHPRAAHPAPAPGKPARAVPPTGSEPPVGAAEKATPEGSRTPAPHPPPPKGSAASPRAGSDKLEEIDSILAALEDKV